MLLDAPNLKLNVNAGVREDEVDAFLTANNLMLQTVTAGGFFSVGGMTAVDVHGATIKGPIFAETSSAYTIMGPDGALTTIDASIPAVNGWSYNPCADNFLSNRFLAFWWDVETLHGRPCLASAPGLADANLDRERAHGRVATRCQLVR
jgi:hypothetical protein